MNMNRPTIIVTLDRRFVPANKDDGYGFVVVGCSRSITRDLPLEQSFAGILLHQSRDPVKQPLLIPSSFHEFQGMGRHTTRYRLPPPLTATDRL
jgi:hypothetical protein